MLLDLRGSNSILRLRPAKSRCWESKRINGYASRRLFRLNPGDILRAVWEGYPVNCTLLFDPDSNHAAAVMAALRGIPCRVLVVPDLRNAVHLMRVQAFECVVVVSHPEDDWHTLMDAVQLAARALPDPPDVICLLRGPYRGSNDRVYAARKGFVLLHE